MSFDFGLIPAIFFSILSIAVVTNFFRIYGLFNHKHVWFLMLLFAIIPFVMVVGILPYDISHCLFGAQKDDHKILRIVLEVLYWLSMFMTWLVSPFVVSYLNYPYSLTLKRRLWYTLRSNLIIFGTIIALIFLGLVVLLATGKLKLSNIPSLVISLANGYGLLVLCLTLGYGFFALPRQIWQNANPSLKYLYKLQQISKETTLCASKVADGEACIIHCQEANTKLVGEMRRIWNDKGLQRMNTLMRLKGELPIPARCKKGESKNKQIKKLRKMDWSVCTQNQLEDFFMLIDGIIRDINLASSFVTYSSVDALKTLKKLNSNKSYISALFKRAFAVIILILNLVCLWSEICLMFNIKLSLFYLVSHLKMPSFINISCVSTPILSYLMFIGAWSLKNLRIGSFYRFVKGATNPSSLNYFAVFIGRLGPTIGFHYLQQIGAYESEFQKVMGSMDVVVFIGTKWNIYSPILLIVIFIMTMFHILERIQACCGRDTITHNSSLMDPRILHDGEEVLMEIQPESKSFILAGLKYNKILENTSIFAKRQKPVEESLLNDVCSESSQASSFYFPSQDF